MHKILGDAEDQHREGASRQEDEARKNENVNDSCGPVARVLPLAQPKLHNLSQSDQWSIKTEIAFATKERCQALRHNVGKTCDTQKMNEQEEDSTREINQDVT